MLNQVARIELAARDVQLTALLDESRRLLRIEQRMTIPSAGGQTLDSVLWCDVDGTVLLPFNPETGEVIPDVWQRWLARDPVRMVPRYADALPLYRQLQQSYPQNTVYAAMVRVLEQKTAPSAKQGAQP